MKFSGSHPRPPESETLLWGSQGESDECSRLGLTAVEFMVKSSFREARQRPKDRGRERSLFKGKAMVCMQSEGGGAPSRNRSQA